MDELIKYLNLLTIGSVKDTKKLEEYLLDCWDEFEGNDQEGMVAYKLRDRMENVSWNPPLLTFSIERHGGTVMGSSRAEIHNWELNTKNKTANCSKGGYRQVEARNQNVNVKAMAEEIFELIINRSCDERLNWGNDESVRVNIGKVIPGEQVPNQTTEGRRKRFRSKLDQLLLSAGWRKVKVNLYAKNL